MQTEDILLELKKSFFDEKREIQERIAELDSQILECKEFIESLNKKDECDFNMFSPRSASRIYKDQVAAKQLEIEEAEEKLKVLYRKLSTVTKKVDLINGLDVNSLSSPVIHDKSEESFDKSLYLKIQEDDRQRIASDLHDTVLQNLALVMHNLELAQKFIDYDTIRAKLELESNRKLVKDTIEEIRTTIFDLRPMQFDDFGFKRSLENQLETYSGRTNMDIRYHIDDINSSNNILLLSVFRIVQELVLNSLKHSKGTFVSVQVLSENDKIYIEIYDDGVGMIHESQTKPNHFGLNILKERVDILKGNILFPIVEKGFKAVIEIPV